MRNTKSMQEQLKMHKEKISRLTQEVDNLNHRLDTESFIYFPRKAMASRRSVKEALTCLINYLDLKIETIEPPGVKFTKKGD